MKNILKTVWSVLFLSVFSFAGAAGTEEVDRLFMEGNSLYRDAEYERALEAYSEIEGRGYVSSDLFYNMGNVYFKMERIPEAILYYERALVLSPSDEDISNNLDMAREMTVDRIEKVPEFIFKTWIRDFNYMLPSDAWAWLSLAFLVFAAFSACMYFLGRTSGLRKSFFFTGAVMLLFAVVSFGFSYSQYRHYSERDAAVVMSSASSVKGSPDDSGKSLMILHGGTKVRIMEELSGWSRIELEDGRQGWIRNADVERV